MQAHHQTLLSSLNNGLTSAKNQAQSLYEQYIQKTTNEGWITAILWQRQASAIYSKLVGMADSFTVSGIDPAPVPNIIYWTSRRGAAYNSLTEKMDRVNNYIATLDPFFKDISRVNSRGFAGTVPDEEVSNMDIMTRSLYRLWEGLATIISREESATWKDPLLELQEIGLSFTKTAYYLLGGGTVASWFNSQLGQLIFFMGLFIFFSAVSLGSVFPMLPIVTFVYSALQWFIAIITAIIAAPIWLISFFLPHKEQSFFSAENTSGLMLLLSILIRPALILCGILVALLLMRIGLDLSNILIGGGLRVIVPDTSSYTTVQFVGSIAIYLITVFGIVSRCSLLIIELPDIVMSYLSRFSANNFFASPASTVAQSGTPTLGSIKHGIERTAISSSAALRVSRSNNQVSNNQSGPNKQLPPPDKGK